MSDVTVKRLDEFESNQGFIYRARAGLGVTSFGMQVEQFPPNFEHYPEHDEAESGQEEVYVPVSGAAYLIVDGEEHRLEPGSYARVGPGEKRKLVTRDEPVELICLGGVPGKAYEVPAWSEAGAPWPGSEG